MRESISSSSTPKSFGARVARAFHGLSIATRRRREQRRRQEESEAIELAEDLAREDEAWLKEAIRQEVQRQLASSTASPHIDAQPQTRGAK